MTLRTKQPGWRRQFLAVLSAFAIGSGDAFAFVAAAPTAIPQTPASDSASSIPADQLDSLVAPVALYPDPLLAQVLAASTYPLELIQLQQWLENHRDLQGKALADAVAKQPWDPSIQAMAGLPDLVKRLANDITWTTDLGNAFLAQQADVMDAVQRMRQKAEDKGALKTTTQQTVTTTTENNTEVIVIEQADPEVIYVPSYNPTVVWGAPVYPYPPIYYPPYGSYAATAAISFGVGVAMGAFWGGGGWGWNCGWGRNEININNYNNFNRNANINRDTNVRGGNTWQHNASHRGGTPYRDRATANKFGGTARGDSLANRQSGARQQLNRQGGQVGANRPGGSVGTSGMNRGERGAVGTGGSRVGGGVSANRPNAGGDRGNLGSRPGSDRGNLGSRSGGGSGSANRPSTRPSGADRIGSRDVSRGSSSGAFSGGGFDGARARSSSSRGSSSMRSGGGGGSRGGGGRSRGGGGRR